MFAATPVRKPVITECDTNRAYRPRRARPAAAIRRPAMSVSRKRAAGRSSAENPATAEPAASAAADVVVITMSRVPLVSPPTVRPATLA
jgi:hypothetical protein